MSDLERMPPGTIDAHVHIGRDRYGPSSAYAAVMDRLGIAAAVLVARQWQFDNTELLMAAQAAPVRFRVVAAVDLLAPGAADVLERLIAAGIAGIRVDPEWLMSAPDPVWRAIDAAGLVVSVVPKVELIAAIEFARALARRQCPVRLEHLGGIRPVEMDRADGRRRAILALADQPNVSMLWSGMWLNAGSPRPYPTAHDLLDQVLDAFGAERLCWSGDWNRPGPPIGSHIDDADYAAEADLVTRLAGTDAPSILGGTARRLFGFGDPPGG